MKYTHKLSGNCHCGNIHFTFETDKNPESFIPRVCQCTLCKRHGAEYIADPDGHVILYLKDPDTVSFYRFGHGTADFIICRKCGVLVIAICEIEGRTRAVINIRSMLGHSFSAEPIKTVFDNETAEERLSRRSRNWTGNVTIS